MEVFNQSNTKEGKIPKFFKSVSYRMRILALGLLTIGATGCEGTTKAAMEGFDEDHAGAQLTEEQTQFYSKNMNERLGRLGSILTLGYISSEVERVEDTKEKFPEEPEIQGFERIGINKKLVQNLIGSSSLPESVVNGNIDVIAYIESSIEITGPDSYQFEYGRVTLSADSIVISVPMNELINDYNTKGVTKAETIFQTIAHELGHKTDWNGARYLTYEQRVAFLNEALIVYQQPNRYRSEYSERVREEFSDDKSLDKLMALTEWYADIVKDYLNNPEALRRDHQLEYGLVQKWLIDESGSDFDPVNAVNYRRQIIDLINTSSLN
jgi:hypothetical protein